MNWIKDVVVDILVTLFIAVAVWLGDPWMWWIIAVYTSLLLVAKGVTIRGDGILGRAQKKQQAPDWFLHILYAVNVALLAVASWWLLMIGWCLIWLLSYAAQRKKN